MDNVANEANRLARLTAFVRYAWGPAWRVTATHRAHDICLTLDRPWTPFAEAEPLAFCGTSFGAGEGYLRQHLTGGPGGG